MERLNNNECNPRSTVLFLEIVHTMERISDHCKNIAEVVISGKQYIVHADKLIKPIGTP
jgi:phosphate uptake regulator